MKEWYFAHVFEETGFLPYGMSYAPRTVSWVNVQAEISISVHHEIYEN